VATVRGDDLEVVTEVALEAFEHVRLVIDAQDPRVHAGSKRVRWSCHAAVSSIAGSTVPFASSIAA